MTISIWASMTLTAIFIISGLIFRRSLILTILLLIWMYILIGFNEGGPDINNYYLMYSESSSPSSMFNFGPGQLWVDWNLFTKSLNLNFVQSHALIMVPVMLILFTGIRLLTENVNFVLALMMIYPLPDMVIQRRQIIAMAIIVYAIHFLKQKKVMYQMSFIISVIVAYGFHEMSLLFLPLIVIPYLNISHIFRTMIILDIIASIGISFMLKYASVIFSQSKVELYTQSLQISKIKTIPFVILHFVIVLLTYYLGRQKIQEDKMSDSDELLLKLSVVSTVYTPLYFTNTTFFRYFRTLIIGGYTFFSNDQRPLNARWQLFIIIIFSVIGLNLFFYVLFGQLGFDWIILPIFRDNVLFNPSIYSY